MESNNTFGKTLNALRIARHLTAVELAHRSEVGQSLISGLINDRRIIGEYTARKIGKALQLTGDELEDFVYQAINNCSEKVLQSCKDYPSRLINLVACGLQEHGISPEKISRCVRNSGGADAAIYLDDGKEARIKLEVVYA